MEGDDLGVGRKTGQPPENSHQDGHRQGESQDGRDEQGQDADRFGRRHALVDEELGQEEDLVHQQDERHEEKADEERRDDLAEDVTIQDLRHER